MAEGRGAKVQRPSEPGPPEAEAGADESAEAPEPSHAEPGEPPSPEPEGPPAHGRPEAEPPPRAGDGSGIGAPGGGTAPVPSGSGSRAERLLARRRRGVRHIVRVDVWDHDLETLVAMGELLPSDAQDPARVADAVEDIFDRWIREHRPPAPAAVAPMPPADTPADPRLDDDVRLRAGDERRQRSDRRAPSDRRRLPGEVSNLLGMIEGSPLDRRRGADRRHVVDRRLENASAVDGADPDDDDG